ncbi:hypothetical protein PIB30_101631, partial [Stylosanthes scabra]|nr:hypothetical protein [Stylosanthes scabra]
HGTAYRSRYSVEVAWFRGVREREPRLMRGWGMMGNWRCEGRARAMPWRGLGAVIGGFGVSHHALTWSWRGEEAGLCLCYVLGVCDSTLFLAE